MATVWRSPSTRLNTITVLKSLGLTLAQIRTLLSDRSPSIEGSLRIQVEIWKARKVAADRALMLVEAALSHVKSSRSLSIDDLCNLIRSFEMNSVPTELKDLIAEHITADESQAWSKWWSDHPEDQAETAKFIEAQNALFAEIVERMNAGDDPGSVDVQALIDQQNKDLLKYHIRERGIRQMEWNYPVTVKWHGIGYKARERNREQKSANDAPTGVFSREFSEFLIAAYQKSEYGRLITALHAQVNRLVAAGLSPSSENAKQLARQFRALCSQYSLGDAEVYARYTPFISACKSRWGRRSYQRARMGFSTTSVAR